MRYGSGSVGDVYSQQTERPETNLNTVLGPFRFSVLHRAISKVEA